MYTPIEFLIVEDDPGDIRLTQEIFKDYKLRNELHFVANCAEALDFLRHQRHCTDVPFPVIIMYSLALLREDGLQTVKEILADETLRCIPYAVLTGFEGEEEMIQAQLCTSHYLTKPIKFDGVVNMLKQIDDLFIVVVDCEKSV